MSEIEQDTIVATYIDHVPITVATASEVAHQLRQSGITIHAHHIYPDGCVYPIYGGKNIENRKRDHERVIKDCIDDVAWFLAQGCNFVHIELSASEREKILRCDCWGDES